MAMDRVFEEAGRALSRADRVVVLTGAGVSAESGIPTFRGAGGVWSRHRAEELATPEAFAARPDFVWQWYGERRQAALECQPNPGHIALARLEQDRPDGTVVVTQNVDGLHRRAGSQNVIEVHGSLFRTQCTRCGYAIPDDPTPYTQTPKCPECASSLRPGVVWFGEMLPAGPIDAAIRAAAECDVMLVIGTSAVVYPIADLPLQAKRHGARLVEVNPSDTPLTPICDFVLPLPGGEALPRLVEIALSAEPDTG